MNLFLYLGGRQALSPNHIQQHGGCGDVGRRHGRAAFAAIAAAGNRRLDAGAWGHQIYIDAIVGELRLFPIGIASGDNDRAGNRQVSGANAAGIHVIVAGGDDHRGTLADGILHGGVLHGAVSAAQRQVDYVCIVVGGVFDAQGHHGNRAGALGVEHSHRHNFHIGRAHAIDDRARHMSAMAVFIVGRVVVVHKIFAAHRLVFQERMAGIHAAVHNGHNAAAALQQGGVVRNKFVKTAVCRAPGIMAA